MARLGSYEVVRKLARGGMAELFLARTVTDSFERLVVIKKILSRYADNPRFVQLFHDEAKLAKSLKHKNIVEVFDVGGVGGESFFAMEYMHGQDVRSILHRAWRDEQRVPIQHAVQIATQVASALNYAHSMRRPDGTLLDIVHRDVSPSNVIVGYDGAVKLVDFGVAKAASSSVKTRTGTLKGKIAYMSPEQAKGGSVDKRSDVFSLGIVLWEMITTTRLFRGENDLATLQLIINEAPKRPSEVNSECPKELERIVLRALAQDPKQRYQTALELQQELEEFVRTQQLVQSASALGQYMSVLFQPELSSWKQAEAEGTQLSEHLTSIEGTTPVSESEFVEPPDDNYDDELEDDLDDLDQAAISGSLETKEAWPQRAPTPTPVTGTPVPIANLGSAPVLRPLGPVLAPTLPMRGDSTPPPIAAPLPMPAPVPTPSEGFQRPPWPPGLINVSVPAPDSLPFSAEQALRLRRQFITVGAALFVMMLLIGMIKACASGDDAPKPPPENPEVRSVTLPLQMPAVPDASVTAPIPPPEPPLESGSASGSAMIPDPPPAADASVGSGAATKPSRKDTRKRPPRTPTTTQPTYDSPIAPPRPRKK